MPSKFIQVGILCLICYASHSTSAHSHFTKKENGQNGFLKKEIINLKEHPPSTTYQNDINFSSDIHKTRIKRSNNKNITGDNAMDDFLKNIFLKYGDGNTIDREGFEKLLVHLDLQKLLTNKSQESHSHPQNESRNNKCLTELDNDLIKNYTISTSLNKSKFCEICPALLYTLTAKDCVQSNDTVEFEAETLNHNWAYSILAVAFISVCGIFSVAIIPVMKKNFYKPLIQFLVALAVGTLAGDALLHLLPHAMTSSEHGHGDDEHTHNDTNIWKGFVAMCGLTFFFIMEKIILVTGKWRKKSQKHKHSHVTVLNEDDERKGSLTAKDNNTQCMDRYNPFPYCYKDIMDNANAQCELDKIMTVPESGLDSRTFDKKTSPEQNKLSETGDSFNTNTCSEINKMLPLVPKHNHEDVKVIVREHKNNHHGHSHKHGHVHAAPSNLTSVAWMVIMGDGLHNFTDGMAIGAAFSGGLASGFSTTFAVFCHELPHELGDFAMLLKAGMSIKQALFYNLLSSILCVLGNLFGLYLGDIESANSWVFAAAAGMFIYIALVDMMPELSSSHEDEENLCQCVLHLGGLLLGFGIMTLIAIYEHDIKHLFRQ